MQSSFGCGKWIETKKPSADVPAVLQTRVLPYSRHLTPQNLTRFDSHEAIHNRPPAEEQCEEKKDVPSRGIADDQNNDNKDCRNDQKNDQPRNCLRPRFELAKAERKQGDPKSSECAHDNNSVCCILLSPRLKPSC